MKLGIIMQISLHILLKRANSRSRDKESRSGENEINFGCYWVQSRSSKKIFTWARPILAQASKFLLKLDSL